MAKREENCLTEDFLYELFFMAFKNKMIAAIINEYIKPSFLPDQPFQKLHKAICTYYKAYKEAPSYGSIKQKLSDDDDVIDLIDEVEDTDYTGTIEALIDDLEEFIRDRKAAKIYEEFGELYAKKKKSEAREKMKEYTDWLKSFSLKSESFVEIISTFEERHLENRIRTQAERLLGLPPISRFYIDDLDELNRGQDLRTQFACFLAASGVGKSHIARHVGKCAAEEGLDVLHFQLEGSKEEVCDAYSGSLIEENAFNYSKATIGDKQMARIIKELKEIQGTIRVRSFPRFNNQVSTVDISNGISEYKKSYGKGPDIVIIDSMDLLTDSSGRNYTPKDERHKRIGVVTDLKDIAGDENCFMIATTQANINEKEWLDDPKNVLTEYNAAEAKGIVRPLTWLISLNQTSDERRDNAMRLHVAKSRFTKKGQTFKIATDYDHEIFFDRDRTITLQKLAETEGTPAE